MKVYLSDDNPLSEVYLRYRELLERSNKYDLVINAKDLTSEMLESHKEILLIERLDGAAIWCRGLLKHPHVKTLLKMYHYPSIEANNRPCVDGRLFIPFDGSEKKQIPVLTREDVSKVRCGFNFMHYSRFGLLFKFVDENRIKPLAERSLFYFFAGTTRYNEERSSGRWITAHRNAYADDVEKIGRTVPVVVERRRAFSAARYLSTMAETKIILSPFGWGEYCYRDYEALACGCVLVKPRMEAIAQDPDINSMFLCADDAEKIDWRYQKQWHSEMLQAKKNERKIIERILE